VFDKAALSLGENCRTECQAVEAFLDFVRESVNERFCFDLEFQYQTSNRFLQNSAIQVQVVFKVLTEVSVQP